MFQVEEKVGNIDHKNTFVNLSKTISFDEGRLLLLRIKLICFNVNEVHNMLRRVGEYL